MTNTPKLRFKQFSGDWETKKLKEIGVFKNGVNKSKDDFGHGYPFVNLMDVFGKNGIRNSDFELVNVTDKELRESNLLKGDVLFIRSSVKPSGVGLTAVILEDLKDTVYSGFLIRFRDYNVLNLEFKKYCFYNKNFRNRLISKSSTSANTNINQESLNTLILKVPTLEEQEKIGSFFSLIDKKIELQTEKVEELKKYKKGIIQKIFSQELRLKDENGNEFPEWEEKKLGEMGKCTSGVGFSDKYQGYLNLPIKVFKVSDMNIHGNHKFMINANNTVSDELLKQMKTKSIKSPSIIFAKVGAAIFLERKRIVNSEFLIDNNMMAFTPNSSNDIEFMYYLLSGIRLSRYAQVGALPSYNASDISHIKVRIPSLKEQVKMAKLLSKIDEKIEMEQEKLNSLTEYKKGLLQQMFI